MTRAEEYRIYAAECLRIAQLITDGQIITFTDPRLTYIGNGSLFALPFPVLLSLGMLALTAALTRKSAIGLFIQSVGDKRRPTRDHVKQQAPQAV